MAEDPTPIARIEALTGEILDTCASLDLEIARLSVARLSDTASWALALGFVHGAESRLWRMERNMVAAARDQAYKHRGEP